MITQELIDFVKTQLSAGVTREKITSDLLGEGGWTIEQINEAFSSLGSEQDLDQSTTTVNKHWTKNIPRSNKGFMVVSLLLFLGLDLFILISEPDLLVFWLAMLVVMLIFVAFYYYENYKLAVKFETSTSKLDPWILALVALRNVVFVLNFVPVIQILGGMALIFGGVPYLIVYYFVIKARHKSVASIA